MADITYQPIDEPKPVANDIWLVDSGPMRVAGMPIPVRMTVIRLPDNSLLLHSPTQFSFALKEKLETLGTVRHLVAPNTAHWSFMAEWQAHFPDATSWGAPGLRKRPAVAKAGLRLDRDLADGTPTEWQDAIEVVVVEGQALVEAVLFHRPSRTLVLTDLVVNVEPDKLPLPVRLGAKLVGAAAPHGRAPIYARAAIKAGGERVVAAGQRLVALAPERVIFAHGAWFDTDGTARLRAALDWLLPAQ
jgi:hypothetical protein